MACLLNVALLVSLSLVSGRFDRISQAYQDRIAPLQLHVDQVNESASRITSGNVLLPHVKLNQLEELNGRWKMLQISGDDRQKQIEQATVDFAAAQQQFLGAATDEPWERAVAINTQVPYYIK